MHNADQLKQVNLDDLKKIINIILDRMIVTLDVKDVTIEPERDFYWDVPSEFLFTIPEDQPDLEIGRLSDDWQFLQNILKDPDNGVSLMLIHVAPLLRWIGEKIGK